MQRVTAEAVERGPVQQRRQLVIFQHLDFFFEFRARWKPSKKLTNGMRSLIAARCATADKSITTTAVVLRQHRAAGLANRHHVLVIAKIFSELVASARR